ncbi:MAG: hypothetical protein ACTSQI_07030 [Candidatus Helarchaeota archaeon]
MLRELRSVFYRRNHAPPDRCEPRNIWEGNYFEDLDTYLEQENRCLQQIVQSIHSPTRSGARQFRPNRPNQNIASLRDEMLEELHRLRNIMLGVTRPDPFEFHPKKRNKQLLYDTLEDMGFPFSIVKQTLFIHKKYGMFEIDLNDSNVHFIPSTCLSCDHRCGSTRRHICIVRKSSTTTGYCVVCTEDVENGWTEIGLTPIDLLIISKAVALENNMIPEHVINQIRNSFQCKFAWGSKQKVIQDIRNIMLKEFNYPPEQLRTSPPPNPRNPSLRTVLLEEIHALFRRMRDRHEIDE